MNLYELASRFVSLGDNSGVDIVVEKTEPNTFFLNVDRGYVMDENGYYTPLGVVVLEFRYISESVES